MSDKMREALREAAELLHSYQTTLGPTRASTSDDDDARLWDRIDACREVLAAQPEQSAEPVADDTYAYARRLAVYLWAKHYAKDAPEWRPCDDLYGVLSQIDNMLTGMTRQQPAPSAEPVAKHTYAGLCPDENQPDERDPECPACKELMTPPAPSVPDGMVLVPIEPTPEMLAAYKTALYAGYSLPRQSHIWDVMLAAAPKVKK